MALIPIYNIRSRLMKTVPLDYLRCMTLFAPHAVATHWRFGSSYLAGFMDNTVDIYTLNRSFS